MTRALLLSAYDAGSHARWHRSIVSMFDDVDWTVETLPPRHFKWRYRSNALTWGLGEFPVGAFDLVVATSVTNLAALVGLRPELAAARKVVYFHENQFEYPTRDDRGLDAHFALQEVLTASVADRVLFNSNYNRDTCLDGASAFFGRLPDGVPPGLIERIWARSGVVPVPVETPIVLDATPRQEGPLRIVWNHRWEHDKGPELLRDAIDALKEHDVGFELHVVGQTFREQPGAFDELAALAPDQIGTWGWIASRDEYIELLRRCHVVLSTAHHEFQGMAVIEAMASGCRALVPDALAYPEYVPAADRYDPGEGAAERIAERLAELSRSLPEWEMPRYELERFGVGALRGAYAEAFGLE